MNPDYTYERWQESFHDLDTPAENLDEFRSFVRLWNSKRVGNQIPSWSDFGFEDFQGWHGWVCVFDAIDTEPFDFHVRLWGTYIVDLLGFEMTGKSLRHEDPESNDLGSGYTREDLDFMAKLQHDHLIGVTEGMFHGKFRHFIHYKDVFLPMSTDGQSVDKLLSATVKLES